MLTGATAPNAGSNRAPVLRACVVYGIIFSASGFAQPYFPIWLISRELSDAEIAAVLSAPMLLRILVAPALGAAADRARSRSFVVRLLAPVVFALALLLWQAHGFWAIFALAATMMTLSQAIAPVVDATVITLVRQGFARDFGRIRLWGSASFAVASIVGGFVLASAGPDGVFAAFVAATGLVVIGSFVLPSTSSRSFGNERSALRLFRRPVLLVVFIAAALVLASHATFNSFGSIHLRAAGYPNWSVGLLWALATSAEIAMFWAGPFLAKALGPYGTLLLAAGAAIFRWTLMSRDPGLALTALLQLLHAATFSGSYLGLMQFIKADVDDRVGATAQGAFVTVLGAITALTTLAMGPLYARLGSGAYQVAALLPLVAVGLLFWFREPLRATMVSSPLTPIGGPTRP
jgi:MFS transporter, PPP family, 3-phenylpropionic acid transporter